MATRFAIYFPTDSRDFFSTFNAEEHLPSYAIRPDPGPAVYQAGLPLIREARVLDLYRRTRPPHPPFPRAEATPPFEGYRNN